MGLSLANIDVGNVFSSLGSFAKDLRAAITGKEPISADKAAEISLKIQELEASIETARVSVMRAEVSSSDKWTSRARPSFLYLFYFVLATLVIIAPFAGIFFPVGMSQFYVNVKAGFEAIPEPLWWVFCTGYLGYAGARTYEKKHGVNKA